MPRSSVTATSSRVSSFSTACAPNAHAEHRRAVAQAQEDRAGIGAEFPRFLDRQQRARAVVFLLHHQRIAMHHIGAGIAVAFQRQQLLIVGAQMRGAIEHMGDEGRLPERKRIECGHVQPSSTQARSCGEAR